MARVNPEATLLAWGGFDDIVDAPCYADPEKQLDIVHKPPEMPDTVQYQA